MTSQAIGNPIPRIDGRAKVTGQAKYAADFNQPGQVHAVIVPATIGLGRVTRIDADSVKAMPGLIAVISHLNAQRLPYNPHKGAIDPQEGERLHVLQDDKVHFYGQPVAVVVAETLDQAERAANALRIEYESQKPAVEAHLLVGSAIQPNRAGRSGDSAIGDADAALANAAVKVDAKYEMARENHNPMEPHATVASWNGDQVTLWSKSQFVVNEQAEIAAVFGIPVENVQVICPFIGGAFGTSLRTWPHVTLAALAARHVKRPTKLVLTRKQMFYTTGHRPHSIQRLALGASRDGKLTALIHEGFTETSRYENFVEALISNSGFMYSCPNVRRQYRLIPTDTSTPTYMRGPGEADGVFALESALDELSYLVGLDPIELRRRNEPKVDESNGKPFSSRSLLQCYDLGAERFGWSRRAAQPRSMRDGRLLIGMGMSTATYPVLYSPASARVRLLRNGIVEIEAAASDMGPGTYTSMTQVAADTLGIPLEQVRFSLGRSNFPPTPPHGGSQTMASVGSAIRAACLNLQKDVTALAVADRSSPVYQLSAGQVAWRDGQLVPTSGGTGISYRDIAARHGQPMEAFASARRQQEVAERFSMHAFGAVFVEIAINPDVGIIKVRRIVGAYGVGKVVNPRLARSQCTGGFVGGIGMALMEQTVLDSRDGRPVNAHMADYLMPVNLDMPEMEAHFVDEHDPHVNELGVKGLGEISITGVAPAIANAVYHATGKRVRELPIRLEDVLST
ncbi:xanthine dehydrogenase family protein molybdopterin-binding subunit [uncultured Ferrovibrio sp.]|uniref:xanthine dehydrogenase family protein molybdopterin-binding subunit n=1 Tax=uncultured Ferrovibrio sp. TaxID=1576913 RepID=UPI0026199B7E|nr:xanthine dehydrogenase family protein molybdopterin-binding subunit [uncultured Ferrovibrio sp.]